MALQFLKEKDRSGLITQTKTEVTKFKENEEAKRSQGQTKPGQKETTIEELVEAEKPKNKHILGVGTQLRKRKSMVAIKHDAVSSKIKMFSNPLSTSSPAPSSSQSKSKMRSIKSSISTQKLLIDKKPEAVVNEILMKTLEEHRLGQKTANDTISSFDEIFATNCPSDLDESFDDKVEGRFNMLLEEEEISDPKEGQEAPPSEAEASTIQDQDEETLNTVEVENEESKGKVKEILESLEKFEETESGEEEVRYSCDSCGKHFKFLTYLKGHQSSKANCNSKEIKKKRQSMNVSRLGSF